MTWRRWPLTGGAEQRICKVEPRDHERNRHSRLEDPPHALFPQETLVEPVARAEIAGLLEGVRREREYLIENLHRIQDRFGSPSAAHLNALAEAKKLPMAEVYELATVYHHFDVVQEGEAAPPAVTMRVCETLSCRMADAQALLDRLLGLIGPNVRAMRRRNSCASSSTSPAGSTRRAASAPPGSRTSLTRRSETRSALRSSRWRWQKRRSAASDRLRRTRSAVSRDIFRTKCASRGGVPTGYADQAGFAASQRPVDSAEEAFSGITILIRDLSVRTLIGVHGHERRQPQLILMDLGIELDANPAGDTDHLVDTVDCAEAMSDVRELPLAAGAEFVVKVWGDIMTMPGRPKVPSTDKIDLDGEGKVVGLF